MRRTVMTLALVSAVVVAVVAMSVGVAVASFSGAAGELVYQDNYTYTDLLNNGAFTSDFYLTAVRAPGDRFWAVAGLLWWRHRHRR